MRHQNRMSYSYKRKHFCQKIVTCTLCSGRKWGKVQPQLNISQCWQGDRNSPCFFLLDFIATGSCSLLGYLDPQNNRKENAGTDRLLSIRKALIPSDPVIVNSLWFCCDSNPCNFLDEVHTYGLWLSSYCLLNNPS